MVAVALAMLGVGHEIWRIGSIAWETVYVALAYPLYFFMRRKFATDHLGWILVGLVSRFCLWHFIWALSIAIPCRLC